MQEKASVNLYLKRVVEIFLIISAGCFTFFLSLADHPVEIAAGVIISMMVFGYLIFRHDLSASIYKSIKVETIIIGYFMTYYVTVYVNQYFLEQPAGELTGDFIYGNTFVYGILFLLFDLFTISMTMLISHKIIELLKVFFRSLTKIEKNVWLGGNIVYGLLIPFLYSNTIGFWKSYDVVYSIDSGWCTNRIFPHLYYADIRHVNFTITFPMYAISNGLSRILGDIQTVEYIILALLNIQFLFIIGILLRKMTKSYYVLALFLASSPAVLFSIFIEKYNISVLLLVVMTYAFYKNKKSLRDASAVLAIGAMSTSIFICLTYLQEGKFKKGMQELILLGIKFIALLVIFGRMNYLLHFITLTDTMLSRFASSSMTVLERIFASFDAVASCLFVLPLHISEELLMWESVGDSLNVIGAAIVAVCIIGFLDCRKEKYGVVLGGWSIFLFVLFIVIGWAPATSPLFALYFSWAYIPLFVLGIERICKNRQFYKRSILMGIIFISTVLNVYHVSTLLNFLKETFPV